MSKKNPLLAAMAGLALTGSVAQAAISTDAPVQGAHDRGLADLRQIVEADPTSREAVEAAIQIAQASGTTVIDAIRNFFATAAQPEQGSQRDRLDQVDRDNDNDSSTQDRASIY
jgi:hypothetical protein